MIKLQQNFIPIYTLERLQFDLRHSPGIIEKQIVVLINGNNYPVLLYGDGNSSCFMMTSRYSYCNYLLLIEKIRNCHKSPFEPVIVKHNKEHYTVVAFDGNYLIAE
jgi:hypothetical protein